MCNKTQWQEHHQLGGRYLKAIAHNAEGGGYNNYYD